MERRRRELATAAMLLTRLPVGRWAGADPAAALWAYPLIGLLVGLAGAVTDAVARRLGLPPLLAAFATLAAMVALTGGLHEDGLADTADGFGARADRVRTLAILRDSRIGTFGTLALILTTGARASAIAALAHPTAALLAAGAIARGVMLLPVLLLAPARTDGLGAMLRAARGRDVAAALAIAAAAALLLLPRAAATTLAASLLSALLLTHLARREIGGYTGDVLGAIAITAEVLTLGIAAALPFAG